MKLQRKMKYLYCILLGEDQVRQLLSDSFAQIGCNASPFEHYVIYKYQLQHTEDGFFAECVLRIAHDNHFETENEIEISEGQSLDDLVSQYKGENKSCIYYRIDEKIIGRLIYEELCLRQIKNLPKFTVDKAISFFVNAGDEMKCLIIFGNLEADSKISEYLLNNLSCQNNIDKLCATKFNYDELRRNIQD